MKMARGPDKLPIPSTQIPFSEKDKKDKHPEMTLKLKVIFTKICFFPFAFALQIQHHPIQEFHYLPKTLLQLNSQHLLHSNQWR